MQEVLKFCYIDDRHRWLDIKRQHGGMSQAEWAEFRWYEDRPST